MKDFEEKLRRLAEGRISLKEPMSRHTTFRVGGAADYYVQPAGKEQLRDILCLCREYGIACLVMGNGSNLLFCDSGYEGVVLNTTECLKRCRVEEKRIWAEAGVLLGNLAKAALAAGLSGLEFAAGIPGSVGGAVIMNAGAYGSEIGQVVRQVRVADREGRILTVPAGQMDFSYRRSAAACQGWTVLEAEFELTEGDPEAIRARMEELAARRREKQPLEYPSAGSTFQRPPGHFASKLIDEAGLKGLRVGGAQVSEKHAGFVINCGGATAEDILTLCARIREQVRQHSGVDLELEVKVIGEKPALF